jgi:hypothetical protein
MSLLLALVSASGGVTGSLAAQETGSDTFSATGKVAVSGSLVAQETGEDVFSATGTVTNSGIALPASGGGIGPGRKKRRKNKDEALDRIIAETLDPPSIVPEVIREIKKPEPVKDDGRLRAAAIRLDDASSQLTALKAQLQAEMDRRQAELDDEDDLFMMMAA